ncbi:extracellular solute-binding protein [Gemmobacter serpentinus]|uniref:extracellular solute-binding protein n=1 Tax=Gemmobacter serpentinus TaxID=2652247 RepID=UPI00124EA2FF|nr:extracellular solute-binding protein [Gemmobacter serpentinus]
MKKTLLGLALSALTALPVMAQDSEKTLYFYNWTDYYPVELLARFEKETGIKVILDGFDSNDTLLAKLQSGGAAYDVIVPSDYVIPGLIQDGLLLKIDTHAMPNYAHMKDAFKNPNFDPKHEYSAPYLWGVTGLAYDSAVLGGGEIEHSWKEFFEPRPEFVGKIAELDTASDAVLAASLYLGIPQCTESNDDAKRILELLESAKPNLKMYTSDSTVDRMASGEVSMFHVWNGATARATLQRDTIRFIYPKEGTPMFRDNFAVPANAPHPENAKIFINWMMTPEIAATVSNSIAYGNAMKSDAFLDEKWRKMDAINMPEEYASRLVPTQDCGPAARELRDRIWTRLKG